MKSNDDVGNDDEDDDGDDCDDGDDGDDGDAEDRCVFRDCGQSTPLPMCPFQLTLRRITLLLHMKKWISPFLLAKNFGRFSKITDMVPTSTLSFNAMLHLAQIFESMVDGYSCRKITDMRPFQL